MPKTAEEIQRAAREFSSSAINAGFIPQALHEYQNKDGKALFWKIRLKNHTTGEKIIRPMHQDESKKFRLGEPDFSDSKKPLYRLPELLKESAETIWIVEGELCANVLSRRGLIVTTSGGTESTAAVDWSVLASKHVIIWPDNDIAGTRYAKKVTEELAKLNCKIEYIDVGKLDLPIKGDCVDWLNSHKDTTPQEIMDLPKIPAEKIINKKEEIDGIENTTDTQSETWTSKFIINNGGVFYKSGEDDNDKIWVCSKLEVKALVRDSSSENWGRLLEFNDKDKILHRWSMPMEMLKGGGEELRNELLRLGLNISPQVKARNLLVHYIMTSEPEARARCVRRTGWHDHVFVLPHTSIGKTSERIFFQSETRSTDYKVSGSLQDWQTNVSKLCEGNSRLVFSVSTAFAALLLYIVDHESGGIHFVGESSTGKTTALRVAASVYGGADYLNRWRATANGLEALAAIRSDTLLILDELSQVNPIEAGEIAYLLANGSGKSRANRNGNARARNEWRILFLSAGEIGLGGHLSEGGKKIKAGQEVRLVDIPADAGGGKGIFEQLHGYESGAQLSKVLVGNAQKYYGTPLIHFLEIITVPEQWENNVQLLKILIQKFMQVNLPEGASGQVHRVCERFALISAAGELASLYKITGWEERESEKSAAKCFEDWLANRGTHGNQERVSVLSQVKSFFELHGESRFSELSDDKTSTVISRTNNRAGFKKKIIGKDGEKDTYQYYVFPEIFKKEMCLGFDIKHVARVLVEEGWIEPGNDGNSYRREYLPNHGQSRCYVFTANIWKG